MANMRRVAPAMKRLQERYANDREKLSKEMMALYQKEGANPLGQLFANVAAHASVSCALLGITRIR